MCALTCHTRGDINANATSGSRVTPTFMIAKILMNVCKETIICVKSQDIVSTLLEAMNAYAHKATTEKAQGTIHVFLIPTVHIVANTNC